MSACTIFGIIIFLLILGLILYNLKDLQRYMKIRNM
jgi:hypothetical protein